MATFNTPAVVSQRLAEMGRLIQAAREERAMTQSELAKRASTSRPTVHRLESGKGSVAWGTVMTVCWVLDLPSDPDALDAERRGRLEATGEIIQRVRPRRELDDDF